MSDIVWAANWYKTRRHIDIGCRALCSEHTTTWPNGYHRDGAYEHHIPSGNSDDVMALRPCALCVRKHKAADS